MRICEVHRVITLESLIAIQSKDECEVTCDHELSYTQVSFVKIPDVVSPTIIPCLAGTPNSIQNDPCAASQSKLLPPRAVVLGLFVLVLELRTHHSACYRSNDAVAAELVASEVSCSSTSKGAHQASIALSLIIGVGGAVLLLPRLSVCVWCLVALRVLVMSVGALLRELVLWLSSGISSLSLLTVSGMNVRLL